MGHHAPSPPVSEDTFFSSPEYDEIWIEAEQKTAILLSQVQPSKRSEESRRAVIHYVQWLIERELKFKVFSFGSVPLKTYLQDGDIDLTAISDHGLNDDWAKEVCRILECEERIDNSEFRVKEVKCISAEVSVVKCLVQNIIVDITFNQLGGLSTLCFLEEVDKLIGRDHLFKRSILLVKAWCFYESRILGAHHGLLSTYALEVLVLYIFHIFHRSLRGPLEVLFRFLQIFSKFNWDQHCLSLWGPVPLGLLHTMTEEPHKSSNSNFLLSEDFLKSCRERFSTPYQSKNFVRKFMNLADPLRPFNNLGRSVNSGNLVRIYSAFAYGAAQLEKLLESPKVNTAENLASFFRNTQKHCQGHRPDAGVLSLKVNAALCNGSLRREEANFRVMTASRDLNNFKHRNSNGACADKPACVNVDHASLGVDNATQCIANLNLEEKPMILHDKDGRACGRVCAAGDSPWSSDSLPTVKRLSVDFVCKSFESSDCNHHVSDESMAVTKLEEDLSISPGATSTPTVASVCFPEVGADSPMSKEQAVFSEGDSRGQMQTSKFRDTDAAILEGDFETYIQNLKDAWCYQNFRNGNYGLRSFPPRGSAWEDPRRPASMDRFAQNSNGRYNVPILGGVSSLNNSGLEGFRKQQRGTGTFFPNLKSTLERDRHIYSNGVRSPRRTLGNMDSYSSFNHNAPSGFRSKSNMPRKHDGSNKARPRRSTDLKVGEQQQDPSTDDALLQNPTIHIVGIVSPSHQRHLDSGFPGDHRLTAMDWSPRSLDAAIVSTSSNKDLPLEKLEIGSFGPGFLAKGLQKNSEHKEHAECMSQNERPSPCDSSCTEPQEAASKAGDHADQQRSAYRLKEEDFPPLPLVSPHREVPNTEEWIGTLKDPIIRRVF